MHVAEIRLLRYMRGREVFPERLGLDKSRPTSGGSLGVEDIRDTMTEHLLQWFDHVMRRDEKDLARAILRLTIQSRVDEVWVNLS